MNSSSFLLLRYFSFLLLMVDRAVGFIHYELYWVLCLLLKFLSLFAFRDLDLLEEENLRFPFEANLFYFVLHHLHGLFCQTVMISFALRFMNIIARYVSAVKNFGMFGNQFLFRYHPLLIFKLLFNYSLS